MTDASTAGVTSPPDLIQQFFAGSTRALLRKITLEVADKYGVTPEDFTPPHGREAIRLAKAELYYRVLTETTWDIKRLANHLGRDHTTLIKTSLTHMRRHKLAFPRGVAWAHRPSKKRAYDARRAEGEARS